MGRLATVAILTVTWTASAATIPAGTVIEIRLLQPISSYSTPKGAPVSGVLIAPVGENGRLLLPLGTTIEGSVAGIRKVGMGVVHETARVNLQFTRIALASGETIPIQCRITEVENARETVDAKGRVQGIRSTATLSHRATGMAGSLAFGNPIAAVFTTAASASVLRFSEPEISLPVGAELIAKLTAPVDIPASRQPMIPPISESASQKGELIHLVETLPFRTYTNKTKIPSDITNLIFIGSAASLEKAFADSGWVQTDALNAQSTYSTIRSIAENQGYHAAPMSTLLLGDEEPEYTYSKTLDTFSKRHHLRIWRTSRKWKGREVWTSSSTQDIGIGFSKSNKTFIHLIDTHIDNERAKVANDLIYSGCVSAVQLVSRPWLPKDAKNGTGEELITDGKIAILDLNNCDEPLQSPSPELTQLKLHGNQSERATRQTVLTLKNNILRDNVGVMAYSGIHYAIEAARGKEPPRPKRSMEIDGEKYTLDPGYDHPTDYLPSSSSIVKSDLDPVDLQDRWAPPSVELGLHGSWVGYAGGNGGLIGMLFDSTNPPGQQLVLVLGNSLGQGWNLGGSVTLDSGKYLSHELSFDQSFTKFTIGLAVINNDTTTGSIESAFAFSDSGLLTSQVAYNLLINATSRRRRWRPYVAIGPALQLMHLDDAPIKKAPGFFRLGLSNIGLISAAYNFGSTPPLEGGGIFQVGLNYGGGVRYRVTPRWMLRFDYRETLTSQPDFWTKSKDDILNSLDYGDFTLTFIGPELNGLMRTQRASAGVSFTF